MNPNPSPSKPDDQFIQETLERRQAEKTLRLVLQGASGVAGVDFFRLLTQYLAAAMEVELAFVAELMPQKPGYASMVALVEQDDFQKPFEYPLAGTPCEHVIRDKKAYFAGSVAKRFPEDLWLAEHAIESYHGVPMLDAAGEAIGHLGVLHRQPMPMTIQREAILRVFAVRAGAELDRQRATRHFEQSSERFRALVDGIRLGVREVTMDGVITFANKAHERIYGFEQQEMIGMSLADLMVDDSDRQRLKKYLAMIARDQPTPSPYVTRNLTKSGKVINVQVDWNYKRDPDGQITGLIGGITEIDSLNGLES